MDLIAANITVKAGPGLRLRSRERSVNLKERAKKLKTDIPELNQ